MKNIKILGTGCPSCIATERIVKETVAELQIEAKISKITEIEQIMMYDILSTPAVVVDEKVVLKGKIPTKEEVMAVLR